MKEILPPDAEKMAELLDAARAAAGGVECQIGG